MQTKIIFQSKNIVLATSKGLVKIKNEDGIGIRAFGKKVRICICDGHWGSAAANLAKSKILRAKSFPTNKSKATSLIENIQKGVFNKFGLAKMNPEKDFTPETGLLAVEIDPTFHLKIFSYGDCRLIISRNGKIKYKHKMHKTWLGAFSFLTLRNRLSVKSATVFKKIICQPNDLIWLFTDGIDECKYEKPTIRLEWLAKIGSEIEKPKEIVIRVMQEVEKLGAEDNASIAIIKC